VLTRLRQVPSPTLVIASMALVLAVGGGSVAVAALHGQDVRRIAANVADKEIAAQAPGLSVKHATSADNAANAGQLGGVPASGYTQSGCDTETGQVKGFAQVDAATVTGSYSTTGVTISYNCSGSPVEAERIFPGIYRVRFDDAPMTLAVGNVAILHGNDAIGGTLNVEAAPSPGVFEVAVLKNGEFVDSSFQIVAP
jgi:hypothetical protein